MEAGRPVGRWRRDLGRGDKGIRTGRCLRWTGKNEWGHTLRTQNTNGCGAKGRAGS